MHLFNFLNILTTICLNYFCHFLTEILHKPFTCRCEKQYPLPILLLYHHVGSYSLHPQSSEKVTLVLFSHFPTHHLFQMMDSPSSLVNTLFEEQDGECDYVTKNHFFIAQRASHQESKTLGERIKQLATDLRQSEA